MAAAPQYEYQQKSFEAAIPVLIIVLLVVGVIALNPSLVEGVPFLGDIFVSPALNVLIIGESATEANDWRDHLTGDLAKRVFSTTPNFEVITDQEYNRINSPAWLDDQGYDILILTAKDLTPALQLNVKDWVSSGGRLLVIGTGGTQPNGRWASLGELLPVSCGANGDCSGVTKQVFAPTLYIEGSKSLHGLKKNVDTLTPLTASDVSINLADVTVETQHILYIGGFKSAAEVTPGDTGDIYPGITENAGVVGGRVVYLSFNPTTENLTPEVEQSLVINTIAYVAGLPGYQST